MGGKSGGDPKMPVTSYSASLQLGICHGPVDSINKIFFNGKLGWSISDPPQTSIWDNPRFKLFNQFRDQAINSWQIETVKDRFGRVNPNQVIWSMRYRADWARSLQNGHLTWKENIPPTPNPVTPGPLKKRKIISVELHRVYEDDVFGTTREYMKLNLDPATSAVGVPEPVTRFLPRPQTWEQPFDIHVWAAGVQTPDEEEEEEPEDPEVQHTIYVNKPSLFGGEKKEGGVQGTVLLMKGGDTQTVPNALAQKFNRTSATMPAYRGVANAWFYKDNQSSFSFFGSSRNVSDRRVSGFYWSHNVNRIPDVWINVTRIPKGLDPDTARIGNDANPAHIIYEAMTNTDWGMGAAETAFDLPAWKEVAQALYDEKFGLSMMWVEQMEIEAFVSEVLDHIEASLYVHPRTGLFVLKLIRDDYDVNTLRTLTPDNADLSNFQRKAWGETINEISVTYVNPENEEEVVYTIQDTGNIGMQGDVITDNRNYYGIRSAELAARVAERDLRAASAPLSSCDVSVDRSGWDLVPGEVVKLTWPEYGIEGLVMRVGNVDYGRPGEPRIQASLVEDIFFMPSEAYSTPPTTEWIDPREAAVPLSDTKIITAPYYLMMATLGITDETSTLQPVYPEVMAAVMGSTYQNDAQDFTLQILRTSTTGEVSFESAGRKSLTGLAMLRDPMVAEVFSDEVFISNTPVGIPLIGGFALIGNGTDFETELVLIESFSETTGYRLRRGVLDTVPRAWPADTVIRFFVGDGSFMDPTIRADFGIASYKLLTRTSLNELAPEEADVETGTLNGRPHYPFRPANVKLNNMLWGPLLLDGSVAPEITWSLRSRLQETAVISTWTDGSAIPEDGQTTNVAIYDHKDVKIAEQVGLTGTSASFPSLFEGITGPTFRYRVESERDDLKSLQAVEHEVEVVGYGMNYGNHYGGLS